MRPDATGVKWRKLFLCQWGGVELEVRKAAPGGNSARLSFALTGGASHGEAVLRGQTIAPVCGVMTSGALPL